MHFSNTQSQELKNSFSQRTTGSTIYVPPSFAAIQLFCPNTMSSIQCQNHAVATAFHGTGSQCSDKPDATPAEWQPFLTTEDSQTRTLTRMHGLITNVLLELQLMDDRWCITTVHFSAHSAAGADLVYPTGLNKTVVYRLLPRYLGKCWGRTCTNPDKFVNALFKACRRAIQQLPAKSPDQVSSHLYNFRMHHTGFLCGGFAQQHDSFRSYHRLNKNCCKWWHAAVLVQMRRNVSKERHVHFVSGIFVTYVDTLHYNCDLSQRV